MYLTLFQLNKILVCNTSFIFNKFIVISEIIRIAKDMKKIIAIKVQTITISFVFTCFKSMTIAYFSHWNAFNLTFGAVRFGI
jgi:hypothetical protein